MPIRFVPHDPRTFPTKSRVPARADRGCFLTREDVLPSRVERGCMSFDVNLCFLQASSRDNAKRLTSGFLHVV